MAAKQRKQPDISAQPEVQEKPAPTQPPAPQHAAVSSDVTQEAETITQENEASTPNNTTSLTRIEPALPIRRRPGKPYTPEQRAAIQDAFISAFSKTANVRASCLSVASSLSMNINRETIYRWLHEDEHFADRFQEAEVEANDVLRAEAWRRGVQGIEEPVVSMGKLVYHEGKPLTVKKYDTPLLLTLMKARMPEFREKTQVDLNASGSINVAAVSAHQLTIDVRNMTQDELAEVRRIAQAMKEREEGRHNDG